MPKAVQARMRQHQDAAEARPDKWIRYDYPDLIDTSRQALADYLNVPVEEIVMIHNATTGVNTVLSNLVYEAGDVIIYFSTIYGSCEKTIEYMLETRPVESHRIDLTFPVSNAAVVDRFQDAIKAIRSAGKNPRVAVYDTIVSMPGVRLPFEDLTKVCREENILSCIDAAHGIGHIALDLPKLNPDFWFSNCHKWLYTPRSSAVLYVPIRNQHLIRSTMPTSHGFQPRPKEGASVINNPLPPSSKSNFVEQFEFIGTLDNSPYLCVPEALAWRSRIRWQDKQGDEAVMSYCNHLARRAGKVVAEILGTEVMENQDGTLEDCNFSNVRLPLSVQEVFAGDHGKAVEAAQWMSKVMVDEHDTFLALLIHGDALWVRLSAQVYLVEEDFKWGGEVLKKVCEQAKERARKS